jgi:hypothetical protein
MTGLKNLMVAVPVFLCALLAGCGKDVFIPYVPPGAATIGTGNWFFSGYYEDRNGAAPYYFGGSLINNGGQLSGVLHIDQSCFGSYATDVPYTGTLDSKNNLSITSFPVSGQVLNLQGALSTDASTLIDGTFSVPNSCDGGILSGTFGSGPFAQKTVGFRIPALTGTWTSSSVISNSNLSFTEQLTQSLTPDVHGDYALTGTIAVQGSACFTNGTLQTSSFVSGEEGHELFLMDDGSTLDAVLGVSYGGFTGPKPILALEQGVIAGGKCNGEFDATLQ